MATKIFLGKQIKKLAMKKIYINENQITHLYESEITFYDFLQDIKRLLKTLLTTPSKIKLFGVLNELEDNVNVLVDKMLKLHIISKVDHIDEVPNADGKHKHAIRCVKYQIIRKNCIDKMKELFKSYKLNENYDIMVNEDGEGATSCGSAMQSGGSNPDSGQFEAPFGKVQRKKFWAPVLNHKNMMKSNDN